MSTDTHQSHHPEPAGHGEPAGDAAGARDTPPGANSLAGREETGPARSRRARARLAGALRDHWVQLVVAGVFGGVVGAFFSANPGLIPNVETGSTTTYPGVVIAPSGVWEHRLADFLPRLRVKPLNYYAHVTIRGYCIGHPTRNSITKRVDERWLVLADGHVVPAPALKTRLPFARIQPQRCPGQADAKAGPTSISLVAQALRNRLRLEATAPRATTVGFALFDRNGKEWRRVALEQQSADGFAALVPRGHALVAMAAACWAADIPAHPASREPLTALQPLGADPEVADEEAADRAQAGAGAACSPPRNSPLPAAHPRRGPGHTSKEHPPSRSSTTTSSTPRASAGLLEPYEPTRETPSTRHSATPAPRSTSPSKPETKPGDSTVVPPLSN